VPSAIDEKPIGAISCADLRQLRLQQLMDLFRRLDAPDLDEMNGEYEAVMLDAGAAWRTRLANLAVDLGGKWLGKAFQPLDHERGHGYNTFLRWDGNTAREVRIHTRIAPSRWDRRPSLHLYYRALNRFPASTMQDELRKINERCYLGIGFLWATLGPLNKFAWALSGRPAPWIGPDR
jgi:hypothetical protein